MNPMIAALRKGRDNASVSGPDVAIVDEAPAKDDANPGDLLIEKLSAIEDKVNKICAAMGLGDHGDKAQETTPAQDVPQETQQNDDGY